MNKENKTQVLISTSDYYLRLLKSFAYSSVIIALSLMVGVVGYHYCAELSWVDSFLNASMILTGMGPVNAIHTDMAKMFASFYALFSGIAFLTTIAVFVSPILHRFMCKLHLDD